MVRPPLSSSDLIIVVGKCDPSDVFRTPHKVCVMALMYQRGKQKCPVRPLPLVSSAGVLMRKSLGLCFTSNPPSMGPGHVACAIKLFLQEQRLSLVFSL